MNKKASLLIFSTYHIENSASPLPYFKNQPTKLVIFLDRNQQPQSISWYPVDISNDTLTKNRAFSKFNVIFLRSSFFEGFPLHFLRGIKKHSCQDVDFYMTVLISLGLILKSWQWTCTNRESLYHNMNKWNWQYQKLFDHMQAWNGIKLHSDKIVWVCQRWIFWNATRVPKNVLLVS